MKTEGEFHHFQMFDAEGNIPFSVSLLVHYNQKNRRRQREIIPLETNDIISFHDELEGFDGNFIKTFSEIKKEKNK